MAKIGNERLGEGDWRLRICYFRREENKPVQYLTIWDLILTPIYLLVIIAIARQQREKWYPEGHALRRYFLPGLYVKLGGAIFIGLIYQFYYGGGDTFHFYKHSLIINSSLNDSVDTWLKLILRQPIEGNPQLYPYVSLMEWYRDPSSYTVAVFGALFGLLNGTTYLPIALLFAYFSFTGVWAMFRTFVNIYPALHKYLAIAFLFIPSTFVWGSGVFKDTICMFALGWMTYTVFRIFINRDFSVRNMLMLVISFYLVALVKLYILLAFLPALSLWLLLSYSHKIQLAAARWLVTLLFIALSIGGFLFFSQKFADELGKYSLENVAQTAATTRGWISYVSERQEGSAYDLGEFDPSIGGMLSKFPQAVVVTLFRPFPWEATKVIIALSALEALLFLYFTVRVIITKGKQFGTIFKDPNIIFFLVFSLIFAFAVGISSYNFGSLSRYKIPCLPFYAAFLFVIWKYNTPSDEPGKSNTYLNKDKKTPALA